MGYTIRFLPTIEIDLDEIIGWYDEQLYGSELKQKTPLWRGFFC